MIVGDTPKILGKKEEETLGKESSKISLKGKIDSLNTTSHEIKILPEFNDKHL